MLASATLEPPLDPGRASCAPPACLSGRKTSTGDPLAELHRARGVHDDGDAEEADDRAHHVVAVWPEAVGDHAPDETAGDEHAAIGGEDSTEVGVGLQRVATKPYAPSASTPSPIHSQPRCSRTPCHTSHAPPISATAATRNSRIERATVTAAALHVPDTRRGATPTRRCAHPSTPHAGRLAPLPPGRRRPPMGRAAVVDMRRRRRRRLPGCAVHARPYAGRPPAASTTCEIRLPVRAWRTGFLSPVHGDHCHERHAGKNSTHHEGSPETREQDAVLHGDRR